MIPERTRRTLPTGHYWLVTRRRTARPVVILSPRLPEEDEQEAVRTAMRLWRALIRRRAMVTVPVGAGLSWLATRLRNPVISAASAAAVAVGGMTLLPHYFPPDRGPGARPPAAPGPAAPAVLSSRQMPTRSAAPTVGQTSAPPPASEPARPTSPAPQVSPAPAPRTPLTTPTRLLVKRPAVRRKLRRATPTLDRFSIDLCRVGVIPVCPPGRSP